MQVYIQVVYLSRKDRYNFSRGVFQVREAVSVQFSRSVVSDSLRPHGLQHARPPVLAVSRSLLRRMSFESVTPS